MKRALVFALCGMALAAVVSPKPADAACVSWAPGHWTTGYYWGAFGWVSPYWVPARCVAAVPVVAPVSVVAGPPYYWRPHWHPYWRAWW